MAWLSCKQTTGIEKERRKERRKYEREERREGGKEGKLNAQEVSVPLKPKIACNKFLL